MEGKKSKNSSGFSFQLLTWSIFGPQSGDFLGNNPFWMILGSLDFGGR